MKKLLTVLLTALMVVTLGVVNVAAEGETTEPEIVNPGIIMVYDNPISDELEKSREFPEIDGYVTTWEEDILHLEEPVVEDASKVKEVAEAMYKAFKENGSYDDRFTLTTDTSKCPGYEHEHDTTCYGNVCGEEEHTHSDANKCYTTYGGQRNAYVSYIDSKRDVPGYAWQGEGYYLIELSSHGPASYTFICSSVDRSKGESFDRSTGALKKLTCSTPEHKHTEKCVGLICDQVEHDHGFSCYAIEVPLVCTSCKEIVKVELTKFEVEYNGKDQTPAVLIEDYTGTEYPEDEQPPVIATWTKYNEETDEYEEFDGGIVDAGLYKVTVTLEDSENYILPYADPETIELDFVVKKAELKPVMFFNESGYVYEGEPEASFLLINPEDFEEGTEFEYSKNGRAWFVIDDDQMRTLYGDDPDEGHYEFIMISIPYDVDDNNDYYIRAKADKNHVVNDDPVWGDALTVVKLDDVFTYDLNKVEFYKGKAKNETITLNYTYDDEDWRAYYSDFYAEYTIVTNGDQILVPGVDYTISDPYETNELVTEPWFKINFTDEYANSLTAGTKNITVYLFGYEFGPGAYSCYRFDTTVKVKKHHVPDDDTPSYKVVATGIE